MWATQQILPPQQLEQMVLLQELLQGLVVLQIAESQLWLISRLTPL